MIRRPSCWTCPYWNRFGETEDGLDADEHADCKRLPPVLPTPDQVAHSRVATTPEEWLHDTESFTGVWPQTVGRDWCGEHPQMKVWIAAWLAHGGGREEPAS